MRTLNFIKQENSEKGFTLIEMALSMVIIGLLIAPFFQIYSIHEKREKIRTTDERVQFATSLLLSYKTENGEYPCPAKVNVSRSDPEYGHGVDCSDLTYDPGVALAVGNCVDGVCLEQAIGTGTGGRGDVDISNPYVFVGALPFRDIQLDETSSLDAYGNRLMYAVTYSMTEQATFDVTQGAISVVDQNDQARVEPDGSVDYVIFSTGKSGQGAYSREGSLVEACVDGSTSDSKNCNIGFEVGTTVQNEAIYVASLRSEATGVNFYDDVLEYSAQKRSEPWKRIKDPLSGLPTEDIESLAPEEMGIGTSSPGGKLTISSLVGADPDPALRVSGAAGNNGQIIAREICDDSGNCFNPGNIGGDNTANLADGNPGDGMKCPAGEFMAGIENGAAVCVDDSNAEVQCDPATPVLLGFNGDGTPNCVAAPNPGCLATTVAQCPGHANPNVSLPAAPDGDRTSRLHAGDCRELRYECNAGTWVSHPNWGSWWQRGSCTDSGTPTVTNPLCTSVDGYGPGPLTNYTQTSATSCNPHGSRTLHQDCTCIGIQDTRNCSSCNWNETQTGPIPTYDRQRVCNQSNALLWWSNITSCPDRSTYCQCSPPGGNSTRNNPLSCPTNMMVDPGQNGGRYEQPQIWDVATCDWVDNGPPLGGCVCDSDPVVDSVPIICSACETADEGVIEYPRLADCTADMSNGVITKNATCNPENYFWRSQGSTTSTVNINRTVDSACSCGNFTSGNTKLCKQGGQAHICQCLP